MSMASPSGICGVNEAGVGVAARDGGFIGVRAGAPTATFCFATGKLALRAPLGSAAYVIAGKTTVAASKNDTCRAMVCENSLLILLPPIPPWSMRCHPTRQRLPFATICMLLNHTSTRDSKQKITVEVADYPGIP
jgi:hypothetical protein